MVRPRREILSEKNLLLMGVPKNLVHKTIDDFETFGDENLQKVKNFVEDYLAHIIDEFEDGNGIFFYGSNGTGKTTLASLIVKEAYAERFTARRMTFSRYIAEYTEAWGASDLETKELLRDKLYNYAKAVHFFVLEEVGKEIDTKISAPILEDLLRFREDNGLCTIICTNLFPKTLFDKYGASIASLIQGHMTPIKIDAVDRRK